MISAVGHEIDTTLSDLVADLRAPTPSAAAELAVWSKREYGQQVNDMVRQQASLLKGLVDGARANLAALLGRPVFSRPMDFINQRQQYIDGLIRLLNSAGKNSFEKQRNRLSLVVSRLDNLSPLRILSRGFAVARKLPEHQLIKSVRNIAKGDALEAIVSDGRLVCQVEKIEKNEDQ